jgi:hypothetical protein
MGPCVYCKIYQDSPKRIYIDEETKHRLCSVNNKYVYKTESCDQFEFATYFWCKRWDNFQSVPSCIKRRLVKNEDCLRCTQGKEISEIRKGLSFRNRGLTEKTITLVSRKKPIVLVRRVK